MQKICPLLETEDFPKSENEIGAKEMLFESGLLLSAGHAPSTPHSPAQDPSPSTLSGTTPIHGPRKI
jgi:hypothetical protein